MSSLFDELRRKIEKDAGKAGISAWDLAQLTAAQRRVIRLILRDVQMAYPDLRRAIAGLPPEQRIATQELEETLNGLVEKAWLIRMGQGQLITYRVNLRRKAGSRLGANIWQRLDRHLGGAEPAPNPE